MFGSLLVANRGEIARRIFRTAHRLGLRTVAVCSEADASAPHALEADEAVLIGPAPARESYLRAEAVLEAARRTGAEAIHPGYGFLSENAAFAEAVQAAGLVWVGPPPAAIRAMGLKDAAKALMAEAGVPVTPGYLGEDQSAGRLAAEAEAIGFPVLIKAVAGGGGKGMKRVDRPADFADALASAKREAAAAFGDDRVLLETYVTRPRHIEVQVFADAHGNVVHLFERDCSLQRRHQKVIEEAPAPGMDEATRAAVTGAAVRAARAVDYVGAGTVEFIADASAGLAGDRIWFMEMNTRLQVEHPVTESITGQDLVEWQLRVAAGEPLPLTQDQITRNGWSMEARLYAEDPAHGFLPSIGPLRHFRLPETVRVDAGVEAGGEVSQHYDPMIAKLIVHEADRESAASALAEACREVEVWPVRTNAAFLALCLDDPDFRAGEVDTAFIAARQDRLVDAPVSPDALVAALAIEAEDAASDLGAPQPGDPHSPWQANPAGAWGFRLNAPLKADVRIRIDGEPAHGVLQPAGEDEWGWVVGVEGRVDMAAVLHEEVLVGDARRVGFIRDGEEVVLFDAGRPRRVSSAHAPAAVTQSAAASDGKLRAPMPGRVVAVGVTAGDRVEKGKTVVVVEAMKMEHALTAPFDGLVEDLQAEVGRQVAEGDVLARIAAA